MEFVNAKMAARIEEIAVALTNQLSVVETPGELNSVQKVYEIFSEMDYYKKNPDHLQFVNMKNDKLGRRSLIATMKGGKGNSKKDDRYDWTYRYSGYFRLRHTERVCAQTL